MPATLPHPITVLGRPTCEDTAVIRDRLDRFVVPFSEVDVDRDEDAGRLCESLNDGNRSTPTVLFGGAEGAMTEPPLDAFDVRLAEEGWSVRPPELTLFGGEVIGRPVPTQALVDPDGAPFRVTQFRGRRQLAVFFTHGRQYCRACAGYARQLAAVGPTLAEADARALVVVHGDADEARRWRADATDKVPVLADPDGRWKASALAHVGLAADPEAAALLGLDRYLAARVGSVGPDAGALVAPSVAAAWLVSASFECAECATPVGWGEG